jgi:uncharacterized BrkB/YihY/UPF0761 family membrane protein
MYSMDEEIKNRFEALDKKLDAVYESSERMRKYFKWTLIITIIVIVLPIIGLFFAIPAFLSTLDYSGLGL